MLNRAERLRLFNIFRIWSIVALLPTQVDLVSRRLIVPSRRKQLISLLSYGFFVLHALYKSFRLAYAYFFVPDIPLHQLVIHSVLVISSALAAFWLQSAYVTNPASLFSYMNMTLHGNIGGYLV